MSTRGSVTLGLVIAILVVLGLLASPADRALVATPAWEQLGVLDWAAYSRRADLGNGLIVYPIEGILPTVLAIAAVLSHRLDPDRRREAGLPIYVVALAMLGVMGTTLVAAPIMLGVDDLGDDTAALQGAFDQFTLWGVQIRGGFLAVAFLASVWALVRLRPAARLRA
jgi:hypothetical protein